MQDNGLREDQVLQVRGFADERLRDPAHPEDASNRRVSVIVLYGPQTGAPAAAAPSAKPAPAIETPAAKTR